MRLRDIERACGRVVGEAATFPSLGTREANSFPYSKGSDVLSDYSPTFLRSVASAYSRFNFAMKLALISAGQTASHS